MISIFFVIFYTCSKQDKNKVVLHAAREAPVGGESLTLYSNGTLKIGTFVLREHVTVTGKYKVNNDTLLFEYDTIPKGIFTNKAIVVDTKLRFLPGFRYLNIGNNSMISKVLKKDISTLKDAFTRKEFWKRIDKAFFCRNAKDSLRLLRNEIFARHGRIFSSEDLKEHFFKFDWYSESIEYNDSLLTIDEKSYIRAVLSLETLLDTMSDSLRILYEKELEFRKFEFRDTIIETKIDYTGDGIDEKQITKIKKKILELFVQIIVLNTKGDTLWNHEELAMFAPMQFPIPDMYSDWKFLIKHAPPQPLRKAYDNWPEYVYSLMTNDIMKYIESDSSVILEEARNYVSNFNGEILHSTTNESGGCSYIWYEPIKNFVTFYCP